MAVVLAVALLIAATAISRLEGGQTGDLTAGAFSDAQAAKGESVYLDECAVCHGPDLRGVLEFGGPGLLGSRFIERWRGMTLGDFFELTQSTMPQDSPGRLSGQQYADIIAFILKSNRFPAGSQDLPSDLEKLKALKIVSPPDTK